MKCKLCIISLLLIPIFANAQYEQKMSFTLSAGTFKTFGHKFGDYEPMQMPNYGMGLAANGGLQFRINERFALSAEFGIMISQSWSYTDSNGDLYQYWSIQDTVTGNLIAEGENYLEFTNYSFALKPKYYLSRDKKWNPYISMGINLNFTSAYYEDEGWMERDKRNLLPPDDTGPYDGFLESNTGIGINPGFGLEYNLNEQWHFFLHSGYYFIGLNYSNFKSDDRVEHFHAMRLKVGTRLYFIKIKDL